MAVKIFKKNFLTDHGDSDKKQTDGDVMKYVGNSVDATEVFVDVSACVIFEIKMSEWSNSVTVVSCLTKSGHEVVWSIDCPLDLVRNRILQK